MAERIASYISLSACLSRNPGRAQFVRTHLRKAGRTDGHLTNSVHSKRRLSVRPSANDLDEPAGALVGSQTFRVIRLASYEKSSRGELETMLHGRPAILINMTTWRQSGQAGFFLPLQPDLDWIRLGRQHASASLVRSDGWRYHSFTLTTCSSV